MAGPHPDTDTSYETLHESLDGKIYKYTVEEGNFEHLFNFEANLKICQILFQNIFLA